MAATVADLVAVLRADISQFQAQMGKAEAQMKGASASTAAYSKLATTAFLAIGAAAAIGIVKAISATEKYAMSVKTLQRTTGLAAESASALIGAGKEVGVSVDNMNIGFGLLDKSIANNAKNFQKYGISVQDAQGATLPFDQILGNVADKYVALGGGVQGAALAMNVFGRSGKTLIPLLAQGSQGIKDMEAKAKELGLVIGQDTVDSAYKLIKAQREMGEAWEGLQIRIGTQFLPVATALIHGLTDLIMVIDKVPGPILAMAGGFLVLTGVIAGVMKFSAWIKTTWANMFAGATGATSASELAAEAAGIQMKATLALTEAIQGLATALGVELPAAAAAADEALAGYGATESGLLVPTDTLAASNTALAASEDVVAGSSVAAGGALKGLLGTLGAMAQEFAVVGAVVGAAYVAYELWKDSVQGSKDYAAQVAADVSTLQFGGSKAKEVRALAAQSTTAPESFTRRGMTFTKGQDLGFTVQWAQQTKDINAARAAVKQYDQAMQDAQASSMKLATSFAASVKGQDPTALFSDMGDAVTKANASIDSLSGSVSDFDKMSGQDLTSTMDTLSGVVNNQKSTLQDVENAYGKALSDVTAAGQKWRESIVSNFGGASGVMQKFAGQAKVNFGDLKKSLSDYSNDLKGWQSDFQTIMKGGGKSAADFLNDMQQMGLGSKGIMDAVAKQPKKIRDEFIKQYNAVNGQTKTLGDQIANALGPPLLKIQHMLENMLRVMQGLPPIDFDITPAQRKIQTLVNELTTHGMTLHGFMGMQGWVPRSGRRQHEGGMVAHEGGAVKMHMGGGLRSDERSAILQVGEYVVRRSAVQRVGLQALEAINRGQGGGDIHVHVDVDGRQIAKAIVRSEGRRVS
jgi:TP901 family phage tail tape measure protein